MRPLMILTVPMAWLLIQFDSIYGYAPLPVGEAAVITAQLGPERSPQDIAATLELPPEIAVETPEVRSAADREISWRIRPLRSVLGNARLKFGNVSISKSIAAGNRSLFLVRKRVRSWTDFLLRPEEARLPSGPIDWIEVDYPRTDVTIAGIALPWLAWFILISAVSALVFARYLRMSR